MSSHVARLTGLRRYPVKSLAGEELTSGRIEARGLDGDRVWAVRDLDGRLGSGKTTRRFRRMPGLLALSAGYDDDLPVLAFPDGREVRADDPAVHPALSRHVGRPVTLRREGAVGHFDEGPLHLVTSSSLRAVEQDGGSAPDPRRLRPNLVVDTGEEAGFVEDGWLGRHLAVGTAVLAVRDRMPRCLMVDQPQVGVPEGPPVLGVLGSLNDVCLGVVLDVVTPGRVALGDVVRLLP